MPGKTPVFNDRRVREIYDELGGDHDAVLAAVQREFGLSEQQAYIATEFLYRPDGRHGSDGETG